MDKRQRVEEFCAGVRAAIKDAVARYANGEAYQFYLMLKAEFPDAQPWYDLEHKHVLTELYGKLWDITGWVWTLRREPPYVVRFEELNAQMRREIAGAHYRPGEES